MTSSLEILAQLEGVRFKYKKSEFVWETRLFFETQHLNIKQILTNFKTLHEARRWLYTSIKGIGIKEASHFLRNTGLGGELAILDRHVLRFLRDAQLIDSIPTTLTESRYFEYEQKLMDFSRQIDIPMSHLDFVLFYRATGKILK